MVAGIRNVVTLLVLLNIVSVVHTIGLALGAASARARISKIKLFEGGKVASLTVRALTIEFGWVPIGASIQYADHEWERVRGELPVARRVALRLDGCFASFLLAVLILQLAPATTSVLFGFGQVVIGALAPASRGPLLAQALFTTMSDGQLVRALGLVAAKMTAVNIMAVIPQLGLDLSDRASKFGRFAFAAVMVSTGLWAILAIGWAVAIVRCLAN